LGIADPKAQWHFAEEVVTFAYYFLLT